MEPVCDKRLQLFVVAKTLSGGQKSLEVKEKVKIAGSKIRARLESIVENSTCVEVGNTTNTCEEVSIRTISTILPAKSAKNKALSLNPAAKVEEKQFETLNKETATHIGIREAEDWFRPIDLAKECDIYISSRSRSHKEIPITYGYTQDPFKNRSQNFKPMIKENYPQYLERENKNCCICGDSSHYARDLKAF
ncbi:hypothetical protein TNCV_4461331 [Trichonephila clavipes]|nr:hypothetical protein TNCV_4461331 [Trichonephila clavipes]